MEPWQSISAWVQRAGCGELAWGAYFVGVIFVLSHVDKLRYAERDICDSAAGYDHSQDSWYYIVVVFA